MNKIIGSMLLLLASSCLANTANLPPEQIHCRVNDDGQLNCRELDRQYLTEDTFSDDLQRNKEMTFLFYSATAYYTPSHDSVSIFYQYKTLRFKTAMLRTVNTAIAPDMEHGQWRKRDDDIYICDSGSQTCGMVQD